MICTMTFMLSGSVLALVELVLALVVVLVSVSLVVSVAVVEWA